MKSKKALLVVSFGTSIKDAQKSIEKIESFLAKKYSEHDFFRAFTSKRIIEKLKLRDGISVDFLDEALDKLKELGYEEVVCQSLHILNGIEYEMTLKIVERYKKSFKKMIIGKPLLTEIADYEQIADMFCDIAKNYTAILLMGHGTACHSNSAYSMLEDMFRYKEVNNIYVGTVEGFPDLLYSIKKMKRDGVAEVTLMPFMIVAGDHAQNDMAGEDQDSWKNILMQEGFTVETELKGLGDYSDIAEMFFEHSVNGVEL